MIILGPSQPPGKIPWPRKVLTIAPQISGGSAPAPAFCRDAFAPRLLRGPRPRAGTAAPAPAPTPCWAFCSGSAICLRAGVPQGSGLGS